MSRTYSAQRTKDKLKPQARKAQHKRERANVRVAIVTSGAVKR